jgi:DNA-binding response OmpR family regulator
VRTVGQIGQRVLIVEDELKMANLLEQALLESGFEVSVATDGMQGLEKAKGHDLLVVDVMMPKLDGFEMVKRIRDQGNNVPVLFLTARDRVSDRVTGLDIGGDDYLPKPFKLDELLARVRALLRRTVHTRDVLEYDDLWLDRRSRKVRRGERWLYLSNTEFALLEALMSNAGRPVSKQILLRDVWDEADEREENLVEVHIHMLRNKLEVMGMPRVIQTVRGKGYVLQYRESV